MRDSYFNRKRIDRIEYIYCAACTFTFEVFSSDKKYANPEVNT